MMGIQPLSAAINGWFTSVWQIARRTGRACAERNGRMKTFHVEIVKPSHYDRDGYVIQWWKAWIPSNSMACLYAIARDCAERKVLGEDVAVEIAAYDEMNIRIPVGRIAAGIKQPGHSGIVCLVGVQSNQFPRAMAIARRFRALGVPVAIGGFHVSGILSMLKQL